MPHEDRRIFFDYDESYRSIYSMCQQKNIPKPPVGSLINIEASYETPFEFRLVFENHKTNLQEVMVFTRDFIIAALMITCRNTGIPLPKGANKSMELEKDRVILRVQIIR